jgi:hypothetical protein
MRVGLRSVVLAFLRGFRAGFHSHGPAAVRVGRGRTTEHRALSEYTDGEAERVAVQALRTLTKRGARLARSVVRAARSEQLSPAAVQRVASHLSNAMITAEAVLRSDKPSQGSSTAGES